MSAETVLVIQCGISLFGVVLVARRFAIPMLLNKPLEDALCLLCVLHTVRYVVLGAFAPGNPLPISGEPLAIGGDLVSPALALLAAGMLHARMPGSIQMAWVFNLVGLADLIVSLPHAIQANVMGEHLGLAWQVFIYYVPVLLVSHLMMLALLFRYAGRLQDLYRAAFGQTAEVRFAYGRLAVISAP